MEEEFQESEVIFSDHDHDKNYFNYKDMDLLTHESSPVSCNNNKKAKKKKQKKSNSVPVNIPNNVFQFTDIDHDFEEEYDEGELIPPHVIVGRRIAGNMAFSVCTGNGRTLKGRDLSEVRNSILRMTGFLEA